MRKILLFLIFSSIHLNALDRESTLKMYHGIFNALSPKVSISIYTNDKEYRDVFQYSKRISLSDKLEDTDIVLITQVSSLNDILYTMKNMDISKQPIIFVTNYHFLKVSDKIVGAFYWRKGRSQLLFIKDRLEQHDITLPKEYQKFMVDEL